MEKVETQPTPKSAKKEGEQKVCVFITGISHSMQQHPNELLNLLKSYIQGAESLVIPNNQKLSSDFDSNIQGFAFLYLDHYKRLKPALKLKRIRIDENRTLLIKPFRKGKALYKYKKDVEKRRLFVYLIPEDVTSDNLREAFEIFGSVEDAYVVLNKSDDRSKGIGSVVFDRKKDAKRVLEARKISLGHGKFCFVKSNRNEREQHKGQFRSKHRGGQRFQSRLDSSNLGGSYQEYEFDSPNVEDLNRRFREQELPPQNPQLIESENNEEFFYYEDNMNIEEREEVPSPEHHHFVPQSSGIGNLGNYHQRRGRGRPRFGNLNIHSAQYFQTNQARKNRKDWIRDFVHHHSVKPSNSEYYVIPRDELYERGARSESNNLRHNKKCYSDFGSE